MKKSLSSCLLFIYLSFFSQTYQVSGGKLLGWDVSFNAQSLSDRIQLTADDRFLFGALFLQSDLRGYLPNLKLCHEWEAEFDFRIDGKGSPIDGFGDGFAFWHMLNIPSNGSFLQDMGLTEGAYGLMIGFDIFNEKDNKPTNKIHILYGENTGNIEDNPDAFHSVDFTNRINFRSLNFKHVKIKGKRAGINLNGWQIQIYINNELFVDEIVNPKGKALTMDRGSFGFSASTKNPTSRHSVTNVKIYVDKVFTIADRVNGGLICPDPKTGQSIVDLTTYEKNVVTDPDMQDFIYFDLNTNQFISDPKNFKMTLENHRIKIIVLDPNRKLCDSEAILNLTTKILKKENAILIGCGNENETFDLSLARVTNDANALIEYYESEAELISSKNKINNPQNYKSEGKLKVYAKIFDREKLCYGIAEIALQFYPSDLDVKNAILESCTNSISSMEGLFNLENADVTTSQNTSKTFFKTRIDAIYNQNPILNSVSYSSKQGEVFVRINNTSGCFKIAEIDLVVTPPLRDGSVQISNGNAYLNAIGGKLPYLYSIDGVQWQKESIFLNIIEENVEYFYIKDNSGCYTIRVEFPIQGGFNFFTPNNDGVNDFFDFSYLKQKKNLEYKVFDKMGRLVFDFAKTKEFRWDGKFNGKTLSTDSYWFVASWEVEEGDNKTISGWIYLKNR